MFKKCLNILKKIFIGSFITYLILGFILLPIALTWAIGSQGTKLLKTPLKVKSVFFNPFLFQLTINQFQILDSQRQLMAGFDRLLVDLSFLNLLKGIYRVELVEINGLQVNPTLFADGHINLIDLIPSSTPVENKASSTIQKAQPIPKVIVDKILLHKGGIHFQDQSLTPNFSTSLSELEIVIEGFSTNPDSQLKAGLKAKLDQKGIIDIEALAKPMSQPIALETSVNLNGYAMQVLSPYVGKFTGRSLQDGRLDVKMDYRIESNQLTASHKLLIQHFEFGPKVESKDALPLPFGLAVALLEDPQGRINIALPVTGDMSSPKFQYWPLVAGVVRNFFTKIVTKPFTFLASIIAGQESSSDELGYIRFAPGSMDLSEEQVNKIKTLLEGLKQRPKLNLEINGSYDPTIDWKAIMTQAFNKEYDVLRKDSSKQETIVYQQLYQRRFGIRALWQLAKKYKKGIGQYDVASFNDQMKRQLIENAPANQGALEVLAQARAQKVYNLMLELGIDKNRINLGPSHPTQSSMGFVPLEFTLTVI